jgi:hypothetical protein
MSWRLLDVLRVFPDIAQAAPWQRGVERQA